VAYLLDANVFIEAKQRYYGLDVCPGFWEWLVRQNAASKVFSIEKVQDELQAYDDDLAAWAKAKSKGFFLPPDDSLLTSLPLLAQWARSQNYRPAAVTTFLEGTDYYLVAHAHAHGHVVVTHETPSDGQRAVKIPNACIGMQVKCMTPFEMLRTERARFVLETQSEP
jgi:hypothetical protein